MTVDPVSAAIITAAVVGATEFIKALRTKDFERAINILLAVVVGTAAGFVGLKGLDPVSGFEAGIAAAGVYKGVTLITKG